MSVYAYAGFSNREGWFVFVTEAESAGSAGDAAYEAFSDERRAEEDEIGEIVRGGFELVDYVGRVWHSASRDAFWVHPKAFEKPIELPATLLTNSQQELVEENEPEGGFMKTKLGRHEFPS